MPVDIMNTKTDHLETSKTEWFFDTEVYHFRFAGNLKTNDNNYIVKIIFIIRYKETIVITLY